jgi:hypothetical protein
METRSRKSTRGTAPKGVPTQTQCSGHESCNTGKCEHRKPWWHGK